MYPQHQYSESNAGIPSPEIFYGYCHHTRGMRMMNLPDFMHNVQAGYATLYNNPASATRPVGNALAAMMPRGAATQPGRQRCRDYRKEPGCGCDCDCPEEDCHCSCCIRDADTVEYGRCGEVRLIPITFANDSRRGRDVKLELGGFATASGRELGWETALSETQFRLLPCGEKTVLLKVHIDCGKFGDNQDKERIATVDECKVAYATVRAEGCLVRPVIVAVAVLPNDCQAFRTGCQCGCCC